MDDKALEEKAQAWLEDHGGHRDIGVPNRALTLTALLREVAEEARREGPWDAWRNAEANLATEREQVRVLREIVKGYPASYDRAFEDGMVQSALRGEGEK